MTRNTHRYRTVYSHMWHTYGASWHIRISFLLQIIARICRTVLLPIILSLIITHISARDFDQALRAVGLFTLVTIILSILTPLVKYVGMLGEKKQYATSTADYFTKLLLVDVDYFHSHLAGYLTTATRQYVDSCVQFIRTWRGKYLITLFDIVLPLIVIIYTNIWLGIVTFCLVLIQTIYLLWASRAMDSLRTQSRELYKYHSGRMADIISNVTMIRSAAQEIQCIAQVRQGACYEAKIFTKRYALQSKLIAIRESVTVVFFAALLWLIVQQMQSGHINVTIAVLVITYITTILTSIYALSDDLYEHDDLVDKIMPAFDILHRQNKVVDPSRPVHLPHIHGAIVFQQVSYSYHHRHDLSVFNNFSLAIPSGQKIGIVGISGAGKSTLTKLLLRFDDVDHGAILIDGIDIRTMKQTDLRRAIAYVPQEPLLLHTSIRENILLTQPEASIADIRHVLQTAHALQFVDALPHGIESTVGERGVKLSGGQKQRIAIARALLQNAPIIIFDEATSALDSDSEQIIKDALPAILQNKTALVIAHRISTLSHMDRIIVIDEGTLVEDGTHESLLAVHGIYARLWKRQQKHIDKEVT